MPSCHQTFIHPFSVHCCFLLESSAGVKVPCYFYHSFHTCELSFYCSRFSFFVLSLSGFGIRVMVASYSEQGHPATPRALWWHLRIPALTNPSVSLSLWGEISVLKLVFGGYCSPLTEKAMAPHSSTLAWKIPWTEEPGRLQSMGSLRVRHD